MRWPLSGIVVLAVCVVGVAVMMAILSYTDDDERND